jgi:hypothetical protein
MNPLVWANFPLAALFILAWVGIPMWMTFRRPEQQPDYSEARDYFRAKAALERGEAVVAAPPASLTTARRHLTSTQAAVPGRRHSGAVLVKRTHPVKQEQRAGASS